MVAGEMNDAKPQRTEALGQEGQRAQNRSPPHHGHRSRSGAHPVPCVCGYQIDHGVGCEVLWEALSGWLV